jgi:hypothetical protein
MAFDPSAFLEHSFWLPWTPFTPSRRDGRVRNFLEQGRCHIPFEATGAGLTLIDDIARTVAAWPGSKIYVSPMSTGVMVFRALGIMLSCGVGGVGWDFRLFWLRCFNQD